MARVAVRTEQEGRSAGEPKETGARSIPNAISQAVGRIASQLNASAIMTLTKTGATGSQRIEISSPKPPFWRSTPHVNVARQLQLVWGVRPLLVLDLPLYPPRPSRRLRTWPQENHMLQDGDLVVLTAGTLQGVSGSTGPDQSRRRNGGAGAWGRALAKATVTWTRPGGPPAAWM